MTPNPLLFLLEQTGIKEHVWLKALSTLKKKGEKKQEKSNKMENLSSDSSILTSMARNSHISK